MSVPTHKGQCRPVSPPAIPETLRECTGGSSSDPHIPWQLERAEPREWSSLQGRCDIRGEPTDATQLEALHVKAGKSWVQPAGTSGPGGPIAQIVHIRVGCGGKAWSSIQHSKEAGTSVRARSKGSEGHRGETGRQGREGTQGGGRYCAGQAGGLEDGS